MNEVHFLVPWHDMERFLAWLNECTPKWSFVPCSTSFGVDCEDWLLDIYSHYGYYQNVQANLVVEFSDIKHVVLAKLVWRVKHLGECQSPHCNFYYYYCI